MRIRRRTATGTWCSLFHYYGILSMSHREKGRSYFKVPNACVELQIFNYLRDSYRRTTRPDWIAWDGLASAMAYDGEWEPFLRRLADDFAHTTPIRGDIDGEIRIQGYMQAEFGHLRYYLARPEMELARGTRLHLILFQFRGTELVRLEELNG